MAKSSVSRRKSKPKKPTPSFPLTVRSDGRLCKKYAGRTFYFGHVDDWQAAVDRFNYEWPFIIRGQAPPTGSGGGVTVAEMCNGFLTHKRGCHAQARLGMFLTALAWPRQRGHGTRQASTRLGVPPDPYNDQRMRLHPPVSRTIRIAKCLV